MFAFLKNLFKNRKSFRMTSNLLSDGREVLTVRMVGDPADVEAVARTVVIGLSKAAIEIEMRAISPNSLAEELRSLKLEDDGK